VETGNHRLTTNALLSAKASARRSDSTGFRAHSKIGYQARPKIFASNIIKPEMI